jgi:5S rRNA maturation endonuclease (ribonuclease M5)
MRDGRDSEAALEEFVDLWSRLKADIEDGSAVVVVEGERDRRALRRLGLSGSILLVHRGETLAQTAHRLAGRPRRVVVLTDWDREGGLFARRLKGFLEPERIVLDLEYRRRFARILRGEIVHVEGLYNWARRIAERQGISLEQLFSAAPEASAGPTG